MRLIVRREILRSEITISLAFVAAVVLAACSEPPLVVPTALLGIWVTDEPTHADRRFIVRADAIVFGTSTYSHENYSLVRVESLAKNGAWQPYRLAFRELDASVAEIEVDHRVATTPELKFRNQPGIWRPEGSIPDPVSKPPKRKRLPNDGMLMEPSDD